MSTKRDEQTRQMFRLAQTEIDELKDSLRYAEYVLARTKEEKEMLEKQIAENAMHVERVQYEIAQKEGEKMQLQQQMDSVGRQAEWAQMQQQRVTEVAREKLDMLHTEILKREEEIRKITQELK